MAYEDETEEDTRAERIEPALRAAGWGVVEGSRIRREVICPGRIMTGGKRSTSLKCDFVLFYKGHKLATLEAKRAGLHYSEGIAQTKDYAGRLEYFSPAVQLGLTATPKRTPDGPPPEGPPDGIPPGPPEPPQPPQEKVLVKLSDGRELAIQYLRSTSYWGPDGKPISAQEFLERLFGDLRGLIVDEDALRTTWSDPGNRERLLKQLELRG